jgi:uncharacterized protein YjeT (DUF2065 family)
VGVKKATGNRKRGLLVFAAGLITIITGYGALTAPRLDSEAVLRSVEYFFLTFITETTTKLFSRPFSFIGLVVMIVGITIVIKGVKKIVED